MGPATDHSYVYGLQRGNTHDWWPKMVALKIMQQHYAATGDPRVIPFLLNYFRYQAAHLGETPLNHWTDWGQWRGADNLGVIYWLYNLTGESWLLELGETVHQQTIDWTTLFQDGEHISFHQHHLERSNNFSINSFLHLYQQQYLPSLRQRVFYLNDKGKEVLDPIWLYMYLRREEFGREIDFRLFGSARPEFSYRDMADIDIILPDIDQQRKFVKVYLSLLTNLTTYQSRVEDLKLVCDGYYDDLKRNYPHKRIGDYIEECDDRNWGLQYGVDDVIGVSNQKDFISTKADMSGVPLGNYKIIKKGMFVFNVNTARMGDKFAIALCDSGEHIVSSIYGVFSSKDVNVLLPEYLMLFFKRPEFDRYVRFNSWGSAREVFTMDDIKEVLIPIPSLSIQQEIVNIYQCYIERQRIAEKLKEQLNNLCPILIKGSLQTNN